MKKIQLCELVYKKELADGIFDFRVKNEYIASTAVSGQFLHINCGESTLLRRPISICDVYDDIVRFVFEVKGEGTKELTLANVGDAIDILGPLGHGFEWSGFENPVIIGGGIGIFPLLNLSRHFNDATVYLGFRSKDRVIMEDEFKSVSVETTVATDDGSYGYGGYAAGLLERHIAGGRPCGIIYACGPMPMLKAVKEIAKKYDVKCQLSLEQRMGCGIGACLVCSCETYKEGSEHYAKVCKNGPVFWSDEVTLND